MTPLPSGETLVPEVLPPLAEDTAGSLSLAELVRESLDSLLANKGRALLTMLGVIIGVASVVSLMAVGNGASQSITGQIESVGTNLIYVMPGTLRRQPPGSDNPAQTLTLDDAQAISTLNLPLNGIAPQFTSSARVVAAAADKYAQIAGTSPSFFTLNDLHLASGSFFDEAQERGAEAVAVLGTNLAEDLFGTGQAVGQVVRINDQTVRVIGVLAAKGGGPFGSTDEQAFVPISFALQRLFGARTPDGNNYRVGSILISATNSSDIQAIEERIAILLRERHHLKADGSADDFQIMSQASFLSVLNNVTSLLTALLAAIAGISLVVGGIGIMNIMLVSVTERTREIGLRKAVGARGHDILMQFIVEALVISMLGGLLGLAAGALLSLLVNMSGVMPASISAGSVLMAIGFSTAVGLFFGIYPARRAALLNPIDSLRYE
jgi:putative ABC transport system permease protein